MPGVCLFVCCANGPVFCQLLEVILRTMSNTGLLGWHGCCFVRTPLQMGWRSSVFALHEVSEARSRAVTGSAGAHSAAGPAAALSKRCPAAQRRLPRVLGRTAGACSETQERSLRGSPQRAQRAQGARRAARPAACPAESSGARPGTSPACSGAQCQVGSTRGTAQLAILLTSIGAGPGASMFWPHPTAAAAEQRAAGAWHALRRQQRRRRDSPPPPRPQSTHGTCRHRWCARAAPA